MHRYMLSYNQNYLYPTGTQRRIHIDSTWILRWYVEHQISTNFHVISTYFFDVILMVEKIHAVSMHFFQSNFAGWKIEVFSTYFYQCIFACRRFHVVSTYLFCGNFDGWKNLTYFFQHNVDGQKFNIVFGKLQANEKIGEGFSWVCNFKQLTFARMFSLNFSSKSPWCHPVPLKFESYDLHQCTKNCYNLVLFVFTEQLLNQIILEQLHC